MPVHPAIRRLNVDLKRLAHDRVELRQDARELRKDQKELGKDRKAGDGWHQELRHDRKVFGNQRETLGGVRETREQKVSELEARKARLEQRYADSFDPATGLPGDPAILGEIGLVEQQQANVQARFGARIGGLKERIALTRQEIAGDRAKILGLRKEIRSDRREIKQDRKESARDRSDFRDDRHKALEDLRPAEYRMGLKATNRARRELGLKPVDHVIRPGSEAVRTMLSVARANLGYHEGAGNSNKFSAAMGRPGEAWCADFVSYLAKKAGLRTPNTASAQGIADQLKAAGHWKGKHNPQPGDAVTFRWDGSGGWADHVGIVERVFKKNGKTYVTTIEGNSSDGVRRKTYPAYDSVINGYGKIA